MKKSRRKCKHCGEWYEPKFTTTEPCHKYECREKQFAALIPKINRKDKQVAKEKLKTLSDYEKEAKKEFQKYVRLRDKDLPCAACGNIKAKEWHGSHLHSANIFSGTIFDERNVHKCCDYCNVYLHGNLLEFRKGLINRYGEDFVNQLDEDANRLRSYKYTKLELIEIRERYRLKNKQNERN